MPSTPASAARSVELARELLGLFPLGGVGRDVRRARSGGPGRAGRRAPRSRTGTVGMRASLHGGSAKVFNRLLRSDRGYPSGRTPMYRLRRGDAGRPGVRDVRSVTWLRHRVGRSSDMFRPMPPKPLAYNAELVRRDDFTTELTTFHVRYDQPLGDDDKVFLPGQYVAIGLNNDERPELARSGGRCQSCRRPSSATCSSSTSASSSAPSRTTRSRTSSGE